MSGAERESRRFRRVRADHAVETAEDYTELLLEMGGRSKPVRPMDLARRFGVSHVTVLRTLGRLERDGLIERSSDRGVLLTLAGHEMAEASLARHRIVYDFLRRLGVPTETALFDAEGIEHHVSEITLERMRTFLQRKGE